MRSASTLSAAVGVLLLAALGACQSPAPRPPAPTQVAHTKQVIATVESVDMSTRQVLLRTPDGTRATVVAGPEVRNLPQLRAGDRVNVTYQVAIAVQMAQPGTAPINAAALVTQRAAPGQLPGGAVSGVITARVTVVAAAPDGTSVTFTGPSGVSHTAEVSDPQMQSFVQRLKPGDQVDVGYVNEVAVSVEPMR
jgi:hypothetical protein